MKRLLLAAPKGGSGKTMTARNLAVAAAHDGLRVATADLDPQATLTLWSRRRPKNFPCITHYRVEWDDVTALLDDAEIDDADLLVIDTPPSIEARAGAFARLLQAADLVVVPVRPTFDDAESARPFLDYLREEGRPTVAVLNAVKPRVSLLAVKGFLLASAELCPVEVADRTDYARVAVKGLGLADFDGHPGSDEVRAVWEFVRYRLWGHRRVAA